jgi:hypothetical protein
MLVPFMVALISAVGAATITWRSRQPAWALLVIGGTWALTILLGVAQPFYSTVIAVGITVTGMGWAAWKTTARQAGGTGEWGTSAKRSQLIKAVSALGVAGLVISLTTAMFLPDLDREVLRRHTVPPLDTRAYASPLTAFRSLVGDQAEETLFTVEGWNRDHRLRLAVMDTFDGMVYNVGQGSPGSRYDRVGPDLGMADQTAPGSQSQEVRITVEQYSGVWVPSLSQNQSLAFTGDGASPLGQNLYYNPVSDALINPAGLFPGVTYQLTASVDTSRPTVETPLLQVNMVKPTWVPDKVNDLSLLWSGSDRSALRRVEGIIETLRMTGYFSHGTDGEVASKPGHSAYRIAELLAATDCMIGDDEQYAVAAALLLADAGIPVRVVMGFWVDADSQFNATTWEVTGADAHAWVEVPFEGYGWVAFDPTPNKDQVFETPDEQVKSKPRPQILQPPPLTNSTSYDANEVVQDPDPSEEDPDQRRPIDWAAIGRIVLSVGIPLVVIFGPMVVLTALKRSRRIRRARSSDLGQRLAWGWQEILDRAADFGLVAPVTATRVEVARALSAHSSDLEDLARLADANTFGSKAPNVAVVSEFWGLAMASATALARSFPRHRRWFARWSWTSLRRGPRSTLIIEE